jgi:hypothetical protein
MAFGKELRPVGAGSSSTAINISLKSRDENQPTEPIIILFGGSVGNTAIQGPLPAIQTPIWSNNSDVQIRYHGIPVESDPDYYTYHPDVEAWRAWGGWAKRSDAPLPKTLRYEFEGEILGGKRLQSYQGEQAIQSQNQWLNRDVILIGYSAGADTTLVFLDESVPRLREAGWTGDVSHIVLLGGTFDANLANERQMRTEWQTLLDNAISSGTNVFVWDDQAEDVVTIGQYSPSIGALGNYMYTASPMTH